MPLTFGIVAEGVTDQIIIERILAGYFSDRPEAPVIRYIQPPPAPHTDSDKPPAGWTLVFSYLRRGEHLDALAFVDYLIVHIDTDVSDEPGFDVPKHDPESGRDLSVAELQDRVRARLSDVIGADAMAAIGERIVFAVAVHQTECWLLPLLEPDSKPARQGKIAGCLHAANDARRRADKPLLATVSKRGNTRTATNKSVRAYRDAVKPYRKRKTLLDKAKRNPSLQAFIDRLQELPPHSTGD